MDNYSVYVHIFPNGKRYFGITCHDNVNRRFQNGFGYRSQKLLWRAICKYGWENIEHVILHSGISKEEACDLEIKYINEYNTTCSDFGYNIENGGSAPGKFTDEMRKRASERMKGENHPMYGKHLTEEHRQKISQKSKGRHFSEETKKKLSNARKGKPGRVWTEESKKKVSDSLKGRKPSEKSVELLRERINSYPGRAVNARKVICIETGKVFDSLTMAGESIGVSKRCIWRVCNGERKTVHKLTFAYYDCGAE